MNIDDLIIWPDTSWCYRHDLQMYAYKSDDFTVIEVDHPEYAKILNELEEG